PGYGLYDQWAAQSQAMVQVIANVKLFSSQSDAAIRNALLEPVNDPAAAVRDALAAAGPGATCAVLPEGPYVVPFVAETVAV
ncbi:MAG TPA: hypothetical protein VKG44_00920, partial [Candidatus Baltobacteraceae bacterium]|nr:hypothetical protein [Candidatus Baltobacteraceae bacterium]